MVKQVIAAALFFVALCAAAFAGKFEDATVNFERGNHVKAYGQFLALVEEYDRALAQPDASSRLRLLEEMGGELLNVVAAFGVLGVMSERGLGTTQDYAKAAKWYLRAIEEGPIPEAQARLGELYELGRGVPQDYAEAAKWYRLAADQGDVASQINLSRLYYFGRGVPKDYVLAYKWIILAAGTGSEKAVKMREGLEKLINVDQYEEAMRLAREWKRKSR